MKKCDECGKELIKPTDIYTSSVHLEPFGCTITDLLFCENCFNKLKGEKRKK